MKLALITDGKSRNTRLVNDETGEEIDGIFDLDWHLSYAEGHSTLTVKVLLARICSPDAFRPATTEKETVTERSGADRR